MAKKKSVVDKLDAFLKAHAQGVAQNITASTFNKAQKNTVFKNFLEKYSHAQYSAILDSKVCDLCKFLDGKIIKTTDMRFIEGTFDPPQHKHCRCIWVYIGTIENVKANWDVTEEDIEEFLDKAHLKKLKWKGLL